MIKISRPLAVLFTACALALTANAQDFPDDFPPPDGPGGPGGPGGGGGGGGGGATGQQFNRLVNSLNTPEGWGSVPNPVNNGYGGSDFSVDVLGIDINAVSAQMGESMRYRPSELPEWDYRIFGGITTSSSDYQISSAGAQIDTDTTNYSLGMSASKDRFSILGSVFHDNSDAAAGSAGTDSRSYGFNLMPGYEWLNQRDDFVNLSTYMILGASYSEYDVGDDLWRLATGAAVKLSRVTSVGSIAATYTFQHSPNLGNDAEITGSDYMNTHNILTTYSVPLSSKLYTALGLSHTWANEVPDTFEDQATAARLDIGGIVNDNWVVILRLSHSIDGNDSKSIGLHAGYRW